MVSRYSRNRDAITKRNDYEAASVQEYWLIDPLEETFEFFVLRNGRYEPGHAVGNRYESSALPGFVLDLARIRALF